MKNCFEISELKFTNFSNTVKISGNAIRNQLNFESELIVAKEWLNKIVNQVQMMNPQIEVLDLLSSENVPNNEVIFSLNMDEIISIIDMDLFEDDMRCKLISA